MRYYVIAIFVICIAGSGCYTARKAKSQFSRAVAGYPQIAAEYCAQAYPVKDSLIRGDTLVVYDTLWGEGKTLYDTVRLKGLADTIRITKIIQLPGTVITKTITVHDTLQVENTAKYSACELALRAAVQNEKAQRELYDKWRRIARKRFWVIVGLGAGIAIGIVGMIARRKAKQTGAASVIEKK